MSKLVKELVSGHLKQKLEGVDDLLLVNVVGLSASATTELRKRLRAKDIQLMVIKNSLARLATEGTQLAAAFEGSKGTLAMVWGSTDIVALAKEVVSLVDDKQFEAFQARGGVMDGARLGPEEVKQVSKWPSRDEQLSLLLGQILSPGANLVSQLTSVGGALASQIEQQAEVAEADEPAAAAEAPAAEAPASEAPADAAPADAAPAGEAPAGEGEAPPEASA